MVKSKHNIERKQHYGGINWWRFINFWWRQSGDKFTRHFCGECSKKFARFAFQSNHPAKWSSFSKESPTKKWLVTLLTTQIVNIFNFRASHSEALDLCQQLGGIVPFPVNESDFQRRFQPSLHERLWMPIVRSKGNQ